MRQDKTALYQRFQHIHAILNGKQRADLLIDNVRILDVYGETVYDGSILVDAGEIIALCPDRDVLSVEQVFDGENRYAIPGLIDAHFHFESQLAHPAALAEVMVPRGTTCCYVEILDIVSAAHDEGLEAAKGLLHDSQKLPYRVFPFAPAKKVREDITLDILDLEPVIGLGEFDHFSYSTGDEADFRKAAYARSKGMFMNGHWGVTTLDPMQLNLLPNMGATNNHDVWNLHDLQRSLRYGYATHIKFGVGNVRNLLEIILNHKIPTENLMFCSDNVSVSHMKETGHMDYIVNLAIEMGMSPIKAIKMATFNAAQHYKMEDRLGSITPGRHADIVLTESLSHVQANAVFHNGRLVAQEGRLLHSPDIRYSSMARKGVAGCAGLVPSDLAVQTRKTDQIEDGAILFDVFGRGHARFHQTLPLADLKSRSDLCRMAVIERYAEEDRHIVSGFLSGVGIQSGAIAVSFPAPKPYVIVVGQDEEEMLFAVHEVDKHAGACVLTKDGRVETCLPLAIYGMMADLSAAELLEKTEEIDRKARELGFENSGEPIVNKLLSLFISLHRFKFMA